MVFLENFETEKVRVRLYRFKGNCPPVEPGPIEEVMITLVVMTREGLRKILENFLTY